MKKERLRSATNPNAAAVEPVANPSAASQPNPSPSAPEDPHASGEDLPVPAEGRISPEELAELRLRAAKAKENWDQLVRLAADFENYKKRAAREKADALKFANEALMQKFVPVLDNLDVAATAASSAVGDSAQSWQTGVNMILSQLRTVLTEAGLEEIEATGKAFDPNFHEAVSQQETTEWPEGHVVQQLRKGYKLRDRLLRPATVVVAKKPSPVAP